MQGRPLPKDRVIATSKLPKVRNPLENLQGQEDPISFIEPDDRSGQAKSRYHRRKRSAAEMALEKKDAVVSTSLITIAPSPAPITVTRPSFMTPVSSPPPVLFQPFQHFHQTSSIPKSTYYRHIKKGTTHSSSLSSRKCYTCKKCGQAMSAAGHKQYKGYKYCPYHPDAVSYDVWLQEKKKEIEALRR